MNFPSALFVVSALVLTAAAPSKAGILALVDRPGLGENFVTMVECESIVSFGVSTTITTTQGERFRISSQFVKERITLPLPTDSTDNIEKVISELKKVSGKYPQADRSIDLVVARLEQQAMNAATEPATPESVGLQIIDNSGNIFKNVVIKKVEPDGLLVTHSGGVKKLPFVELSEEIQNKYGYDPAKAAGFAKEQATLQAAAREQSMAQARVREEQERKAREMAAERESAVQIHFRITQVLENGLLIWNLRDGKSEFLRVNPDHFDVADGEKYYALVLPNGTFEYISILGVKNRVRQWKFVPSN
jgi:hypothetical protein